MSPAIVGNIREAGDVSSSALATDNLDLAGGSVSGDAQIGQEIVLSRFVETFASTPDTSSGCPATTWFHDPTGGGWTHNAANGWMTWSGSPSAGIVRGFSSRGGGDGPGCEAGPYDATTSIAMGASWKIVSATESFVRLNVGFGSAGDGAVLPPGPHFQAFSDGTNLSVGFRACVASACGAIQWGLTRNVWYSMAMAYFAGNSTTIVQSGGKEASKVGGAWNANVDGTDMGTHNGGGSPGSLSVAVDNMTAPKERAGHWRSASQGPRDLQSFTVAYALGLDTGAAGSLIGPYYLNATGGASYWSSTSTATSGTSLELTDATASSTGSIATAEPPWDVQVRLVHQDGMAYVPTRISSVQVTRSAGGDEGTGGDPLKPAHEEACEGTGPLQPLCNVFPQDVIVIVRRVWNIWLFLFLAIVLAVAVVIRQSQRRGPGPA